MHRNEARPIPTPRFHASAMGDGPGVLIPRGYFHTLADVFAWADRDPSLHTLHVEETLPEYPYRQNGRVFRKLAGQWRSECGREEIGAH